MKVPATLIAGVTSIELPKIPDVGIEISNGFRIITDRESRRRIVDSYGSMIGDLESAFLISHAPAIICKRYSIDIDESDIGPAVNGELVRQMVLIKALLVALWMAKDNAVDFDIAWMAVSVNGQVTVNNNRWGAQLSNANGRMEPIYFTVKEIREASSIPFETSFWSVEGAIPLATGSGLDPRSTNLTDDSVRIQRFMYFVQAGRSTTDLAIKTALWCSGLEALVSSSQSELAHQVSERISCLLEPLGQQRFSTYRVIKAAYGIRSKAVHGASFKEKDAAKLVDSCRSIDGICRRLCMKYIHDKRFSEALDESGPEFDEYWNGLIFGFS